MALQDIRLSLCRKLGYADSPSAEVAARLDSFVNEIHRRLLGMPGLGYLRQSSTTFVTVAGTSKYTMVAGVARIMGIRDTSNDLALRNMSWEWYQENVPDPSSTTGNPTVWVPAGLDSTLALTIALYPTPSSIQTLALDYARNIDDITTNSGVVLVPPDFQWVIEAGAKMLEYERQDDRRYPAAREEFYRGIRDLKWFVSQPMYTGNAAVGRSSLGPWYPAGS